MNPMKLATLAAACGLLAISTPAAEPGDDAAFNGKKPDKHNAGALYDARPAATMQVRPAGKWNTHSDCNFTCNPAVTPTPDDRFLMAYKCGNRPARPDKVHLTSIADRPEGPFGGKKPNVLLICVDDLRTDLNCFGVKGIKTPNLDRLASEAVAFRGHYVQKAHCSPSRAMMLTGHRLSTGAMKINGRLKNAKTEPAESLILPRHFKRNGYHTLVLGKVSHNPGAYTHKEPVRIDYPYTWDEVLDASGPWKTGWNSFFGYAGGECYNTHFARDQTPRLPYECKDVSDDAYPDGLIAEMAVDKIKALSQSDKPFFFGLGFYKPHLPWCAPKRYWDLYDPETIPVAEWGKHPGNLDSNIPFHQSDELTSHYKWPSGRGNVSPEEGRKLKHAYWACVSYVDAQIGKVLDELKRSGLDKNTIVLLWSDHGWHLGEQDQWGKWTTYESGVNSPLIIRLPNGENAGTFCDGLVETIDIFPTLTDLCGLPSVKGLPGCSLRPLLKNPAHPGKDGALSEYTRAGCVGHSLRTDRYRITEWVTHANRKKGVRGGDTKLIELYDLKDCTTEKTNIARDHPELVASLLKQLHKQTTVMRGEGTERLKRDWSNGDGD